MKGHPDKERVKRVEHETYRLLDEIGVPYKTVSGYEWVEEAGTAAWIGETEESGRIRLCLGCDAEAVAHEIGHGFHEALAHHRRSPLPWPFRYGQDRGDGEAVAEAVRYFVEQRLGSSWRPARDQETLEWCSFDFERFKVEVRALATDE